MKNSGYSPFFLAVLVLIFWVGAFVSHALSAELAMPQKSEVNQLLSGIENSGLTFERNGAAYSSRQAAWFLKAKWALKGRDIQAPEQFIDQIATRSSTTGQYYWVRTPAEKIRLAEYLQKQLQALRNGQLPSS